MNISFEGKVALVTGAASGLGLATAKAFAESGASIALADWNEKAARAAADELTAEGHQAIAIRCDVADDAQVKTMVEQTVATFGRLDAAYNNAGVQNVLAETANTTSEDYDRVMGINLRGEWSCMKFELQQMRKQGSGAIVNCSSLGGLVGGAERGIYHAAKHGVLGFTKSAALEYAARGISTPKDIVQVRGTMNLYHYRPLAGEVYRVPILIVMATTNRGYILDLVPGQSFVEFMLKQGYDVYMLDWTPPRPEEKSLPLADYVLDFIPNCIQHIQRESGETEVSVVGYCFGGVLSLLYGSIFPDGPMKNLVCFTTPIDFHEMKLFANFSDRRYFDVDRLVDSVGTSLAFGQLLRVGDGA